MSSDPLGRRVLVGLLGRDPARVWAPEAPDVAGYSLPRRILAGVLGVELRRRPSGPPPGAAAAPATGAIAASDIAETPAAGPGAGLASEPEPGEAAAQPKDWPTVAAIRSLRESEVDALHRLDRLVFGRLAYPLFALRQLIELNGRYCVVADGGAGLLGYCLGALASGRENTGWVLGLGVLHRARGAGYARELLQEVINRLIGDGAEMVRIAMEPENIAAIHLYETLGFRIIGFRPDYFGPEGDRLIMGLPAQVANDPAHSDPDRTRAWLSADDERLYAALAGPRLAR